MMFRRTMSGWWMPRASPTAFPPMSPGFLGTTRITLNDNLLKQGTPDEVLAVLGHEMGHYVMGHAPAQHPAGGAGDPGWALPSCIWGFPAGRSMCLAASGRCGESDDIAGLPLLAALGTLFCSWRRR